MTEFLKKILKGDEGAIIKFYKNNQPKILRFVSFKIANSDDAKEICNDVFISALEGLSFFREESNLSVWLYKIAKNKVINYYRKKKIKTFFLSKFPFLQIIDSEIHEPEFIYEKEIIKNNIEAIFHKLSKKYSQILKMRYEEEMPIKEIAKKMKMSFKSVESLLFRARQSFQQAYE